MIAYRYILFFIKLNKIKNIFEKKDEMSSRQYDFVYFILDILYPHISSVELNSF